MALKKSADLMLSLRILLYRRKLFLECFCFFFFHLAEIMGDKLMGGAAVPAGMFHLPALTQDTELFRRQDYAVRPQVVVDNRQIFVLVRRAVVDDEAEAVREGNCLVHALGFVKLVLPGRSIPPCFLDQMATVGSRVNQHIVGTRFDAALDGRFQIFVFDFRVLEGEIVEEKDEMLRGKAAERVHDVRKSGELRFRDLHETEPHRIVFVCQCLDG